MAVITNSESSTLISGTNNNDSISNTGENVTINGGAGNDTLTAFSNFDTIVLGSVKVNSSVHSNNTVTLYLSNNDTLMLTAYSADEINLVESINDVNKINVIKNNESSTVFIRGHKAKRLH